MKKKNLKLTQEQINELIIEAEVQMEKDALREEFNAKIQRLLKLAYKHKLVLTKKLSYDTLPKHEMFDFHYDYRNML